MKKLSVILVPVLVAAGAWLLWTWGFCRFYVPPGHMAVLTAKTGKALPPGQILAEPGQKGIQDAVLGEGRHFRNPILFEHEIRPVVVVPPGKVGIVTSKVGEELPPGEFLAESGQKGIWRRVLGPGKYRMNPYGYQVMVQDAISIPIGYAGVVTSLSGSQPERGQFAEHRQKGVRRDVLQPGLYYVNPREFKVDVLEIGVNQVSLLGKAGAEVITKGQLTSQNVVMEELGSKAIEQQREKRASYLSKSMQSLARQSGVARTPVEQEQMDLDKVKKEYLRGDSMATLGLTQFVEFPSRDGFNIRLDMTVEIELLPDKVAGVFRRYGDLPAVVDKIIMPQITSVSRNKGSEYRAKDFIVGEGRETFQNHLTQTLQEKLGSKDIVVHNALIRHVEVPPEILAPIQQASIAIEQNLTNEEKQNTAKKLAELNTELQLIEQRREQVAQETEKIKAEIRADQERRVAEIKAETSRKVAEIGKETAHVTAEKVRTLAQAEADALKMTDGERAKGLQLKTAAMGDAKAYSLWKLAAGLQDDLSVSIIHAGQGTLWTDLDKATVGELGGAKLLQQDQKRP
jgi:regulator of protease activity HflC (stomatin/prohibitin superfamily)